MNKVVEFLNANPVQYLATVGRDGKAKCRPFMFAGELDGKLWFCTNNRKDVYKDMQQNPQVEISVSSPSYAWIRLHGKAVFENNMAAKEMCIQNPIVKGQYQTAANPIFEVFYLDNPHGVTPPRSWIDSQVQQIGNRQGDVYANQIEIREYEYLLYSWNAWQSTG